VIGTTLAHYRVTAALGAGGMGEVWRAEDTKLGREVALKVLPEEFAQDPDRMARFEREAKVLASLNHPNIATLYGLETAVPSGTETETETGTGQNSKLKTQNSKLPADAGPGPKPQVPSPTTFLAMELVEGEDLSERIKRGPVPVEEAVAIALQIAEALEAAHEAGIVHRDLKPANIKLRPDGTVKVLDFGLAKAWETNHGDSSLSLSPTVTNHATAAGLILGTAAYMSPEQAAGIAADRRADNWAFGVVLWEMLTGHKLFEGETVSHVLASVLKDEVDLDELPADTPWKLRELISRCLKKKPKQRLQAIGDARIVLEDDLADPGSVAVPEAEVSMSVRRSASLMRSLTLGLAAVLATAAGVAFFMRQPAPRVTQSFVLAPAHGHIRADQGLALSPDGTILAFLAEESGITKLWIRAMDSLAAQPLEGTENAQLPFWSPDGRHLGFFSDGKLKRIPVVGGAARSLADALEPRGGAWGTDDRIIYSPDYRDGLWGISASGGEPRRVTELDSQRREKSHRWPVFLPDGRHILFLAQTDEGGSSSDQSSIEALALADGRRTRILDANSSMAYTPRGGLLFWRGGSLFAQSFDLQQLVVEGEPAQVAEDVDYTQNERAVFTVSQEGTLVYHRGSGVSQPASLEWYSRAGELQSEAAPLGSYRHIRLAPDGRRLAYTEGLTVWVRDLVRGTASRVTHDDEDHLNPVWSPDGNWVAFTTNRTAGSEVRKKLASGLGDEELIVTLDQVANVRAWSPDGRYLAFEAIGPGTEWDCWLYSFEEDAVRPVVQTRYTDSAPAFSPDSRWLAYLSTESGRSEIYVVPVDDQSRKWQVSTEGGRYPVWSPSGGEIFFADLENRLMAVPVQGATDLEIGIPRVLFRLPEQPTPFGAFTFAGFAVAPDGQRFLVHHSPEKGRTSDSLILVQNWNEMIRRGTR
jgi:serine/threonine protein kinase/Tol biopolymer transport system component